MIQVAVLASGSNGNCVYLESPECAVLVDSGVSARQVQERLKKFGRDAADLSGVFLTHDHHDHVCGVRALAKRFSLPVHVNAKTRIAARRALRGVQKVEILETGDELEFRDLHIRTVPVPHDSAEAMCYAISCSGVTVGVITDLGVATPAVQSLLSELDGVVLETNHDVELLERGPYPPVLKARIKGPRGHLSNRQAAELCRDHASPRLQVVYCAHLSAENNNPSLAYREVRKALWSREELRDVRVLLTSRHTVSRMTVLEPRGSLEPVGSVPPPR